MKYKLLFVDDDQKVTQGIKRNLAELDYEIFTADSGQQALDILSKEQISVVVSDEKMPGMTGAEFLSKVRDKYPDTIRIILTGQASLEATVKAINEGEVYRFLLKPCNTTELIFTVRQALKQRELVVQSNKLLELTRRQSELLQTLESECPGIVDVKTNEDGAIIIEEPGDNIDVLIQNIQNEVEKGESLFLDWSCSNGAATGQAGHRVEDPTTFNIDLGEPSDQKGVGDMEKDNLDNSEMYY